MAEDVPHHEPNLALLPGVRIVVSAEQTSGGGSRDPSILLNERANRLDGGPLSEFSNHFTYDTYDGQNAARGPDWYALEFPAPQRINCIEMTMGLPYPDGGWWTSLSVEAWDSDGRWRPVESLKITPDYNVADSVGTRRPYETFALTFAQVTARAVRLIGRPGGTAQFTSLARLAVYLRDLSRWNPATLPPPPTPYVFKLMSPRSIWELSENLIKLTGLSVEFSSMQYYLEDDLYPEFLRRRLPNYRGEPDLWFLIGDTLGWHLWNRIDEPPAVQPHIRYRLNGTLGQAVAPVVVEDQLLGDMMTPYVVIQDSFDVAWHRANAAQIGIAWEVYLAAHQRSPQMTSEQLEGAAGLMGMIANTIANLMHQNLRLEKELARRGQTPGQKDLIRRAIDYMQENLERPVRVADVAKAVALSVPYFCTIFTEQTGRTPGDYLADLRFERAKAYLAHSTLSVMDVCVALGYSPSYFSRFFKRRTGQTPGDYARKMRGL